MVLKLEKFRRDAFLYFSTKDLCVFFCVFYCIVSFPQSGRTSFTNPIHYPKPLRVTPFPFTPVTVTILFDASANGKKQKKETKKFIR